MADGSGDLSKINAFIPVLEQKANTPASDSARMLKDVLVNSAALRFIPDAASSAKR